MRWLAAAVVPLLVIAGCAAAPEQPATDPGSVPFAGCAPLSRPPEDAHAAPAAASATTGDQSARALPDLTLPCLADGSSFALRDLRGPAVITLWASWCAPCRDELPAFEQMADRYGGHLHVVGINTRDRRAAAVSLGTDLGLTFPVLADPDEQVRVAVRRAALPVTLFIDRSGQIRHVHDSTALDGPTLAALVQRHLGLPVSA